MPGLYAHSHRVGKCRNVHANTCPHNICHMHAFTHTMYYIYRYLYLCILADPYVETGRCLPKVYRCVGTQPYICKNI